MSRTDLVHGFPLHAGGLGPSRRHRQGHRQRRDHHRLRHGHRLRPPHPRTGGWTGFTLLELLVVIAIIGLLVGLLLPAVQAARFLLDSRVRPSDVTDGLSHTAAASEHTIGDFDNAVSSAADTFWPQTTPQTADQAIQHCESVDPANIAFQRVSDVGAPWLYGHHSTTIDFHAQSPNRRSCMFPPGRIMTTSKSGHPGGVGLALCDGSTRFVGDRIDLALWRSLGSRAGGETLR